MAEEQKEPQQVTTKNYKSGVDQYYGIGGVIALGVIGGLSYYIYRTKKGEQPSLNPQQNNSKPHPQAIAMQLQTTSLRRIKSILYYKNGQEESSK